MKAEYFLPLIDAALPDNEKRRLIELLQNQLGDFDKSNEVEVENELDRRIMKYITRSQIRNRKKGL